MSTTDPIADMFTKIRNASRAKLARIEVPASRMKSAILEILKQEGYIRAYKQVDIGPVQKRLRVYLKFTTDRTPAISDITRISKPGLRRYVGSQHLPRVMGGLGIAILTTSQGIMSDRQAKQSRLGGEMIGYVW
ncbi:MAG: 30S ribosomal protein S8 [Candidatus Omnitrophica bacterium]|nr:30S ribosomal protein S8 [Candidatus Omnitrophota bacterium]